MTELLLEQVLRLQKELEEAKNLLNKEKEVNNRMMQSNVSSTVAPTTAFHDGTVTETGIGSTQSEH